MLTESVGTVAGQFQILGDTTEKLRVPNAVCANRTVSRFVLEDLRERAGV